MHEFGPHIESKMNQAHIYIYGHPLAICCPKLFQGTLVCLQSGEGEKQNLAQERERSLLPMRHVVSFLPCFIWFN